MHRGYDGAGVSYTELEVLPDFSGVNTLSTGIVGGATRGPLTLTKITSAKKFRKVFGDPVEGDWGAYAALKVLKNSNCIWYKRVVSSRAARGAGGITGLTCRYKFETLDFDESLNGAKIAVTLKPGTSTSQVKVGDDVVQSVNRAAEGNSDVILALLEGESLAEVSKVYTTGEGAIEYSRGVDFKIDLATATLTWIDRPGAPIQKPAAGTTYKIVCKISTMEIVSEVDRYDVVLMKNGTQIEKLTGLDLVDGSESNILTALEQRSDYLKCSKAFTEFAAKSEFPAEGADGVVYFDQSTNKAYTYDSVESEYVEVTDVQTDLNGTYTIAGGNAGIEGLTAEDYIGTEGTDEGLQAFLDTETLDISTLIVPGVFDDLVIFEATKVAEKRGDIVYIPEVPQGLTPQQVDKFSRRKGDWTPTLANKLHQINSKFVAMYYPWVLEYVADFGKNVYTPPSAWVASQYAYNDTVAHTWFAPAGFQNVTDGRGILKSALGLEHNCTSAERDIVYADDNGCVNPIVAFPGKGITIWGNKTSLRVAESDPADSSFTQVSVRRLCNYTRKCIIKASMETLFQPEVPTYWAEWRIKVERMLEEVKQADGIEAYRVQMDRTTISDEDIYYGRAPGKVFVKPVHAIEWIPITFTVTHDSVIFNEGNTGVESGNEEE